MLDARVRSLIDPPLNHVARQLTRRGANPNVLTAVGLGFGAGAFVALFLQLYPAACLFIVLNRLMDAIDGPVARVAGATDLGGYLDIVGDSIFYSGVAFFFATGRPENALAAAFLIYSFVGSGGSFLAYAILASKRGIIHSRQGPKSFFYQDGFMEGTETVVALLLICARPDWFQWIAYIFGGLCWITTLRRVTQASTWLGSQR